MNKLSAEASQAFLRRVILPLGALVIGLMVSSVAGIFWIANYQTDIAIAHQARLATGALRIHAEKLAVSAADYGYWDEAVEAIVDKPDPTWISENVGAGAEKSLGVAMAFALDPAGKAVYSRVGGIDGAEDPMRFFPQGFRAAHDAWKKLPSDKTFSGVVPYGNSAAVIAIAPVRSWDDASRPPTGYALLFVQLLEGPLLASLSRDYELANLRLTHSAKDVTDPRATFSITDGQGKVVSRLTWDPHRPGDDLLKIALPFLILFLGTLTALGGFIFRHAIMSAEIISDREKKAFRDPLTNLANRALFFAEVDKAVRSIGPGDAGVAVMYVDLDGFKAVNDTMGHGAGDVVLQQVAGRLVGCVRDGDRVARLGGDEFAVLFTTPIDTDALESTANRILHAIAEPFQLPAGPTQISCSIGIAESIGSGDGATDLVDRADSALYQAKAAGKNRLRLHDADIVDTPGLKVA